MSGNWGFEFIDHVRSRWPWRTRVALTIASILAAVVLVVLLLQFGHGLVDPNILIILGLLATGIVFGLRPWART
jgi:hypothetical protein